MDPDLKVFDNSNEIEFALIEYDTVYDVKWNTEELNINDFSESHAIKFSIENWLFQTHPQTKVSRWLPRHEFSRAVQRNQFKALKSDFENGLFSFKHTTKAFTRTQFGLSVVAIRKQTKHLEILYSTSLLSFLPSSFGLSGKAAIKEFCYQWNTKTNEIVQSDNLKRCPCTLESAQIDPNFEVDFTCSATEQGCHENVNAHRCFLMSIKEMYVSYMIADIQINDMCS